MTFNYKGSVIMFTPHMQDYANHVMESLVPKVSRNKCLAVPFIVDYFPNKEQKPNFEKSVRGKHVYLIHGFFDKEGKYEPDKGFMQLYLATNALVNASAKHITYVLPHKPYERQDRIDKEHVPISAKCVMDLLKASAEGVHTNLVSFDLHVPQIQGFFTPSDNLFCAPLIAEGIKRNFSDGNTVLVSPDAGGTARTRYMGKLLNLPIAICDKRRDEENSPEIINIVGNVEEKNCIIIDDMIDTSGTLAEAKQAMIERGARPPVYAAAPHAVLSFNKKKKMSSEDVLREADIKIITTNTIPRSMDYYEKNRDIIKAVLRTEPIIARVIYEIDTDGSVSEIYKTGQYNPSELYEELFSS